MVEDVSAYGNRFQDGIAGVFCTTLRGVGTGHLIRYECMLPVYGYRAALRIHSMSFSL